MVAGMDVLGFSARALLALGSVRRREDGQAMVEYALVLFLVALVSIGILGTLGGSVASMLSVVNAEF
jgi:Flp pilus assembly pilin Flp